MDKWKVLKSKKEVINPGIFQEKLIVLFNQKDEDWQQLRAKVKESNPEAEECEVPERILSEFPASFGYWVNKHDPKVSERDLKEGNIRMKISS